MVEPDTFLERILGELLGRHRKVLPQAGQVDETQIDRLNFLVLDSGHDFLWCHPTPPDL